MKKVNAEAVKGLVKNVGKQAYEHSPMIFAGVAITGAIGTTVLAIKATTKAERLLQEQDMQDAKTWDKVPIIWKLYIPTLAMGAVTIACIIMSYHEQARKYAALAGLYSLAEQNQKQIENKVHKLMGDKMTEEEKKEVTSAAIKDIPDSFPSSDYIRCMDSFSGRVFYSTVNKIKQAELNMNYLLIGDMWVSLNELYSYLGLDSIPNGEDFGWEAGDTITLRFASKLDAKDMPCLYLDYDVKPRRDYM